MNFSLGGGKRALYVVAAILLTIGLASCSADKTSPLENPQSSATMSDSARDVAAVEDLVDSYWDAIVNSENSVDASAGQFGDVADGPFIESQLKTVRDYKSAGVRRVGDPDITKVEVAIDGDAADIRACLNEDEWTAEKDGATIKAPKLGPVPWGAKASRRSDIWLVTAVGVPPKGEKVC